MTLWLLMPPWESFRWCQIGDKNLVNLLLRAGRMRTPAIPACHPEASLV